MKSGASDPFSEDSEDERSESSEKSSGERSDPRDSEASEASESRTESEANRERGDDEDERSESSESRAATLQDDAETDPDVEGGSESEDVASEDDGPLNRDELPLVLRRDRVKDERPEVHQLFVQQGTHDRAVDAERALEDRLDVDLSRTDAREAIYLAGMAHLDDAEEILRTWGYDL